MGDFDASMSADEAAFCIHHAKLCADISRLLRSHFSISARKSLVDWSSALKSFDLKLAEWLTSLPADLRDRNQPARLSKLMLHLTYETTLVQVHRLQLSSSAAVLTMEMLDNDKICSEAASSIIRIFEELDKLSALHNCWFWAPSALFTAILQIQMQLRSENPLISMKAQETIISGLRILRRLSQHWLMAESVWRLFQFDPRSSSTETTPQGAQPIMRLPDQDSLDESRFLTNRAAIDLTNAPTEEVDWINFISFEEDQSEDLHIRPNRWQDHSREWQSLYWCDPLSGLDLQQAETQ